MDYSVTQLQAEKPLLRHFSSRHVPVTDGHSISITHDTFFYDIPDDAYPAIGVIRFAFNRVRHSSIRTHR